MWRGREFKFGKIKCWGTPRFYMRSRYHLIRTSYVTVCLQVVSIQGSGMQARGPEPLILDTQLAAVDVETVRCVGGSCRKRAVANVSFDREGPFSNADGCWLIAACKYMLSRSIAT